MKMVTVRIISVDKDKITGQEIGCDSEDDNKSYDKNKIIEIKLNKSIYSGMLAEMKKADIYVDDDLICFTNRIFTIYEDEREYVPVFGVALRTDLEKI